MVLKVFYLSFTITVDAKYVLLWTAEYSHGKLDHVEASSYDVVFLGEKFLILLNEIAVYR